MGEEKIYTAAVVIIGNEILSGRVPDANLVYLATNLNDIGVRLAEARMIADDDGAIRRNVNQLRADHDYVITTGGIGPTHDDITAAAIAGAFGVALYRHPAAERLMTDHYRPEDLTEARMKMADVPMGATLIENPVSRAPGFRIGNVFVLAGVPRIMQAQFDSLKQNLRGGRPMRSRAVAAFLPEGRLAEPLTRLQESHEETEIGSYPFVRQGRFGTSLVVRGPDPAAVDAAAGDLRAMIRDLGEVPIEDP